MAVVINPNGQNRSAWRDTEDVIQIRLEFWDVSSYQMVVSKAEMQLLERLRNLEGGLFALRIRKTRGGMRSIRELRISQISIPKKR